jgi:hypothetical protein
MTKICPPTNSLTNQLLTHDWGLVPTYTPHKAWSIKFLEGMTSLLCKEPKAGLQLICCEVPLQEQLGRQHKNALR